MIQTMTFRFETKRVKEWIVSTLFAFLLCELLWGLWMHEMDQTSPWWKECLVDLFGCALFSLTSIGISQIIQRKWFSQSMTSAHLVYSCITTIVLNICIAFLFVKIYCWFTTNEIDEIFWRSVYIFCIIATLLTLLQTTYRYGEMAIRNKEQLLQQERKNLKQQLDPHFIFNSLNSLAELTRRDPAEAERYVINLSRVYHYILSHIEKPYTTIDDTIQFIHKYVALQQIRVEGTIDLCIGNISSKTEEALPPMGMQLLVENAILHNPPTQENTLVIHIDRDGDWIIVRNNIISNIQVKESFGIGLENLRNQYALEGDRLPIYHYHDDWFEARIPILTKKQA